MEDDGVPERIFDAANDGELEEVEKFLASVAAPRDVVNAVSAKVGNATLLSCVPFGWPFTAGHVKLVRRLISLGADVNHIETDGSSPLIYLLQCFGARCSGKAVIDMISLLLCAGADVNHEREYYEGREFG